MPASIDGTMCDPQVPGTQKPSDMTKLAELNPCPLNVCCNKWGQCGTTKDFCIKTNSITGNPGTSAPNTNGCISNCGMDINNNGQPPSTFRKVDYFEGWNLNRDCLNMDASQIDDSQYDTVHFGFAEITSDFKANIADVKDQFDVFKNLKEDSRRSFRSVAGHSLPQKIRIPSSESQSLVRIEQYLHKISPISSSVKD